MQLPAHANWAKQQAQQQQQQQQSSKSLKEILEQQAIEESIKQKILYEQQKQQNESSKQKGGSGSKWSSLFNSNQQVPPSFVAPSQSSQSAAQQSAVSLANIQAEQSKDLQQAPKQPVTMSQKLQKNAVPPSAPTQAGNKPTTWASWASSAPNSSNNQSNKSETNQSGNGTNQTASGFWGDMDTEPTNKPESNKKQPSAAQNTITKTNSNQSQKSGAKNSHPELVNQTQSKKQQKPSAPTIENYSFLQNMDISDEFMKWCEEQLKYFNVELHIPTFVNFLKEIESCAEIEDYASSYLGESKQAKEFAQQFFLNRESQLKQAKQQQREEEYESNNSHLQQQQQQAFSKKPQKKRSKGHKLDGQLLGFTVQPDPNLKNRGDIDSSM